MIAFLRALAAVLNGLAILTDRLLDALFGPLVPDSHPFAEPSRLDRLDGRH